MPGEDGTQFLKRSYQISLHATRILITAYSNIKTVIDAVNEGAVYKYVNKPWDNQKSGELLEEGLKDFAIKRTREQLLQKQLSGRRDQLGVDRVIQLGCLAADLGHYVNNALVGVRIFLDLLPKKLNHEKEPLLNRCRTAPIVVSSIRMSRPKFDA